MTKKTILVILAGLVGILGLAGCAGGNGTADSAQPQPESTIGFQTPDPEEFIRDYFHAIVNERKYEHLWLLATESFNDANYGSDYQIFVDFWNSVEELEIESVEISERSNTSAVCVVKMKLKIRGDEISAETNYHLIYDAGKESWVFESP